MPKKTLGFYGVICALTVAQPAPAATCGAGYYLRDGTCVDCDAKYYCPGDDTRHSCADETSPTPVIAYTVVNGAWDATNATDYSQCTCGWFFEDESRTKYYYESACNKGPSGNEYTKFEWCRTGYYATQPLGWRDWYTACAPCTNGPAHAHYTSYSTPSEMYAVESNCPWECDDGYGRVGDTCEPLCATGVTHIRAGDASVPLFPTRRTSPALAVQTAGGVCYGNLTPGHGAGINITIAGTTYRLE